MTGAIEPNAQTRALIQPFPVPGRLLQLAYRELDLVINGAQDQLLALRDLRDLPRPWDPATCETPQLRKQVWSWLEARYHLAEPRIRLGRCRRHPAVLATAPPPGARDRGPRRPTPPRWSRPHE
jgi:hypothetical protein